MKDEGAPLTDEVVFASPWFRLLARRPAGAPPAAAPHYCLETYDYVSVVALDAAGRLVVVEQFRPAVGGVAVELPGGHVEAGQEPLEAARVELWEETGYRATRWELLGRLRPDVGRLMNHLWVYWAEGLERPVGEAWRAEAGVKPTTLAADLGTLSERGLENAISLSSLFLAVTRGKLRATSPTAAPF